MNEEERRQAALEALPPERRSEAQRDPTEEEIERFLDSAMSPVERERFEEKLMLRPELVDELADLAAIQAGGADPGVSEESIAAAWQRLEQTIEAQPPKGSVKGPGRLDPPFWLRPALAAAFAFALGGASTLWWFSTQEEEIGLTSIKIQLSSASIRSAGADLRRIVVERGYDTWTLEAGLTERLTEPSYRAELRRDQRVVWQRAGLQLAPNSTFSLVFERDDLPPGEYRLHIYAGDEPASLVELPFRLEVE